MASFKTDPKTFRLHWEARPYRDDQSRATVVEDPMTLLSKLAPEFKRRLMDIGQPVTYEEFHRKAQKHLEEEVNEQLRQVEPLIQTLREEAAAREKALDAAQVHMVKQMSTLRVELHRLARRDPSSLAEWEPTARISPPNIRREIESRITSGMYQVMAHAPTSVVPPIPPARRRPWAPQGRLSIGYPEPAPAVAEAIETEEEDEGQNSGPAGGCGSSAGGQNPAEGRGGSVGGSGSANAGCGSPVGSRLSLAGSDHGGPAGSSRSASGDRGGPAGSIPGPVERPEWPEDDSGSDPEPDPRHYPKRWQAWVKRGAQHRAMRDAAQFLREVVPQAPQRVTPLAEFKVADPKAFKGEPEDLDRFLHQLEDKFSMESSRFRSDIVKIRYTGTRLEGKAYKWYRSYHLHISSRDAFRVRGIHELDPQYASWDRFEASLRASFGERITRIQAVREWDRLKHKDAIDDFVDEITLLMWLTGYEGEVIEDKIRQGLNSEMALEWAKVSRKPQDIGEQLALLRDMGHAIEDVHNQRRPKGGQGDKANDQPQGQQGKGKDKKQKGKGGGQQASGKSSGSGSKSKEWKNRDEMLKGVSKELQEERRKAELCQRCGKPNHKWFECRHKDPITTREGSNKRANSDGKDKESKKPKTSGVKGEVSTPPSNSAAAATSGRIIQIPDEDKIGEDFDVWAQP